MYAPSHVHEGQSPSLGKALRRRRRATVDHIIPRSSGGTSEYENLVGACADCNVRRGTQDALYWFYWLKAERAA